MFLSVMLILWLYFLSFIYFQLFFFILSQTYLEPTAFHKTLYLRCFVNSLGYRKGYRIRQGSEYASVIVRAREPQYSKTENTNDNFSKKLYKVLVKRDFRKGLKVFIVDFVGIIDFDFNSNAHFTLDQGFDSLLTPANLQNKNTPYERL